MTRTPTEGKYRASGDQPVTVHVQQRAAARHPRVTRASNAAKAPLGRSEELLERQEQARQAQLRRQTYLSADGGSRRAESYYNDYEAREPSRRRAAPAKKKKRRHNGLWAAVIFLCLLCMTALGLFVAPQLLGVQFVSLPNYAFVNGSVITLSPESYENYKTYRRYLDTDTIFPGVYVDGVSVGGMTVAQAAEAVGQVVPSSGGAFAVTVNVGNMSWLIDSSQVPMTRNLDSVLAKAYSFGRGNTTAIRGTHVTPFQERLNAAINLREAPVTLGTSMTYDKSAVRQLTDSIVAYVNREPVNASVATFDFNSRNFTFNSDTPGAYIDADDLYNQVIASLDSGSYNASITVEPEMILASVTKAELMNSFRRISSYTTETTSNAHRNTNVELSANAINGRTVMPGETFSFNEATGQRTVEKGYREATAISGGQSVPEVGGGVCQTSSTLFNAVARANLEIVSRSPHAWPSSYVEKGMDATVNWPNLDFKFRNSSDWPIFIVAYYAKRKVTVEIYGMSLGDGVTIDLESVVTQTIKPSDEIKYVQNTSLPYGTQQDTVKKRTGYKVETYKIWYQNGQEIKRELLCNSTYKAYQAVVEYNW